MFIWVRKSYAVLPNRSFTGLIVRMPKVILRNNVRHYKNGKSVPKIKYITCHHISANHSHVLKDSTEKTD